VRIREIGEGKGFRLYQAQKAGNRHLVDIRPVKPLPPTKRIAKVLVVVPAELIAGKVIAYHQRRGKPKSGTDWRDLVMLLLTFDLSGAQTRFRRGAGAVASGGPLIKLCSRFGKSWLRNRSCHRMKTTNFKRHG